MQWLLNTKKTLSDPFPSSLPFPASVLQGWNPSRSRRQGSPPGAGTEQGGDGWGADLSPLTVPCAVPGTLQGAAGTKWVSRSPVLEHKSVVTPGECDEDKCWLRVMSPGENQMTAQKQSRSWNPHT